MCNNFALLLHQLALSLILRFSLSDANTRHCLAVRLIVAIAVISPSTDASVGKRGGHLVRMTGLDRSRRG